MCVVKPGTEALETPGAAHRRKVAWVSAGAQHRGFLEERTDYKRPSLRTESSLDRILLDVRDVAEHVFDSVAIHHPRFHGPRLTGAIRPVARCAETGAALPRATAWSRRPSSFLRIVGCRNGRGR